MKDQHSADADEKSERARLLTELAALTRRRDTLRGQCHWYRSVYEHGPDMRASCEAGGLTILACNERLGGELHFRREQLVGQPLSLIVDPADRSRVADWASRAFSAIVDGQQRNYRFRCRSGDGRSISVSLKVSFRHDERGDILYSRGVARDVSELAEAEAILGAKEERLRRLAETLDVVPWQATVSADDAALKAAARDDGGTEWLHAYRLVYVGPQVGRILGFAPDRWLEPGFWFGRVHPDDLARIRREVTEHWLRAAREYRTEYRIQAADGRWVWGLSLAALEAHGSGGALITGVFADITTRRSHEETQRTLVRELDHRVGNTFATLRAVIDEMRISRTSRAVFLETFHGRAIALAAIHTAMADGDWSEVGLSKVVEVSLAPFAGGTRVRIHGPELTITPRFARNLAMVLHELGTNAVKHGALRVPNGRVSVTWRVSSARDARSLLALEWGEHDGPPVAAPSRRGYGLSFIEGVVPYELDGTANVSFGASGLSCRLEIPIDVSPPGETV